jgi:hypothetical protein
VTASTGPGGRQGVEGRPWYAWAVTVQRCRYKQTNNKPESHDLAGDHGVLRSGASHGGDRVHAFKFGSYLTWPARSEPQGDPMREARTVVDATPKQSNRCVERPGYLKPAVLWEVRPASGTECPAECTCTVTHSDGALIQLEEVGMLWVRGADLCGEQAVTRLCCQSNCQAGPTSSPIPLLCLVKALRRMATFFVVSRI